MATTKTSGLRPAKKAPASGQFLTPLDHEEAREPRRDGSDATGAWPRRGRHPRRARCARSTSTRRPQCQDSSATGTLGVSRIRDLIRGNINLNTVFFKGLEKPIQRRASNDHT